MMDIEQMNKYRDQVLSYLNRAGIVLTSEEKEQLELTDLNLSEFEQTGLALITYVNTERVCAKELVLLPGQTCPEHRHPLIDGNPGKEETFRCRLGSVYLYVPGDKTNHYQARLPIGRETCYTVFHEIILKPGEQYTLSPDTLHWFQAGPDGAVVSEFSTTSHDENDIFTDPNIIR